MKFESDRTYRAIFLSDVHYLLDKKIKFHRHQDLFRLLDYFRKNNIRFKKVILAGDIIENWFFSATRKYRRKKKRFDKLFDRLDTIAAPKGKRIYIVGNHDTTSFTMQLPDDIHKYLEKRGWLVREEYSNGDYVVVHGHQGQYNKLSWAFHIAMVRFFHWLAVIIPNLFYVAEDFYNRHLNRMDPVTTEQKLEYYRRLSHVSHQRDRVLISGHTHDFLCIPEMKIINTGDWVKSGTFVVLKGNKFYGLRMEGRKKFTTEFKLNIT